jgi:hypothetical protein
MPALSTVERAFQLARAGACQSIVDLRVLFRREGHTDAVAQTSYPFVRKQLNDAIHGRVPTALIKTERRKRRGRLNLGRV